jgi:hypothetical protein
MKVAIMQPYFFPYVGYFQLMSHVDLWVVFDQIQFVNKGWVNRNRILHIQHEKGWQYITLPISKRHRQSRICDLAIANQLSWRESILGKLTIYKRHAPYYHRTVELVSECFAFEAENLSDFLVFILRRMADYLAIETPFVYQRDLDLDEALIKHPGDWALAISKVLNAEEYINPAGGYQLFREGDFLSNGIKLRFIQSHMREYGQFGNPFISGLSIIDLLMWNTLDEIKTMLKYDYKITSYSEVVAAGGVEDNTEPNASE